MHSRRLLLRIHSKQLLLLVSHQNAPFSCIRNGCNTLLLLSFQIRHSNSGRRSFRSRNAISRSDCAVSHAKRSNVIFHFSSFFRFTCAGSAQQVSAQICSRTHSRPERSIEMSLSFANNALNAKATRYFRRPK